MWGVKTKSSISYSSSDWSSPNGGVSGIKPASSKNSCPESSLVNLRGSYDNNCKLYNFLACELPSWVKL